MLRSGGGDPRAERTAAHMLDQVTDDAVVKVVHLCPRYALAKGDNSHRSKSQKASNVLTRPGLPLTHCKEDFRKACHSGMTSV